MSEDDPTSETKLTASKRKWASEGKFLTGMARDESQRLPPGQHLVKNWPVLDLGQQPVITTAEWALQVVGGVEHPVTLHWAGFNALQQDSKLSDIHCVTTWSRYDNRWNGVSTHTLLDHVGPHPDTRFVMLTSYDGYTTNLPLADFASSDGILATSWEGEPLSVEHGGPMRLVIPHLYFWKSAKWLRRIEFLVGDQAGFWERNGYHMLGDPWREQRYSDD